MPGRSSNSAGARFEYNGQMKDNDITPYQFAGNTPIQAIDLDGEEPKSVVFPTKIETKVDYFRQNRIIKKGDDYKFTAPVAHLLSLVSWVSEKEIKKISIHPASWIGYNPNKSGGAITMPSSNGKSYDMYMTLNYFTQQEGHFETDFSEEKPYSVYNWGYLVNHEVTHLKHMEISGHNRLNYIGHFASLYIKF